MNTDLAEKRKSHEGDSDMDIIVQKYGGSSLAEDTQLRAVAQRVARCRRAGNGVVVVVSARGDLTSRLLASAGKLNANPHHRELDMLLAAGEQQSASLLSLALQDLDLDAVALTGPQAGVRTCDAHLNARISGVEPERMQEYLDEGKIVVVAGFQGASPDGDITTLGRGGSDTTAVAIAAALGARCEIYSDVDGVYTADPRVVPDASRLRMISLAEMKTLAHHGAGVLNERAIDYAIEHDVTIVARRAHGPGGETVVRAESGTGRSRVVGVAGLERLMRVDYDDNADREQLHDRLGDLGLFAPELTEGSTGTYFIPLGQVADAAGLANAIRKEFGDTVRVSGPVASVSAVGNRAGRDSGVVEFARNLLAENGIEVHDAMVFEHAVTCLIDPESAAAAMRAFHAGFEIADTDVADVA